MTQHKQLSLFNYSASAAKRTITARGSSLNTTARYYKSCS